MISEQEAITLMTDYLERRNQSRRESGLPKEWGILSHEEKPYGWIFRYCFTHYNNIPAHQIPSTAKCALAIIVERETGAIRPLRASFEDLETFKRLDENVWTAAIRYEDFIWEQEHARQDTRR